MSLSGSLSVINNKYLTQKSLYITVRDKVIDVTATERVEERKMGTICSDRECSDNVVKETNSQIELVNRARKRQAAICGHTRRR